jgi:Na+/H+ antiporter NhaD/arsenite permease-like protein
MELSVDMSASHAGHAGKPLNGLQWASIILAAIIVALLIYGSLTHAGDHGGGHGGGDGHGAAPAVAHAVAHAPPVLAVIPFAGLLLSIALLPLIPFTSHWWENNKNRLGLSLTLAGGTLLYYLISSGSAKAYEVLQHAVVLEYIPFIMLLFSLYVISGGICLRGDLAAHPATNTAFLAIGGLLASFIGTTGASMLLIRPLLKTNSERKRVRHTVIFFIFIVSNIGGSLLPIGDPPLYLGYLKGVPFFWTFTALWKEWLLCSVVLLIVYFIWDTVAYGKEERRDIARDETQREPLKLEGGVNLLYLLGVVGCAAAIQPGKPVPLLGFTAFPYLRELIMIAMVALSLKTTRPSTRAANQFNYHAILEVAALFIGIFICMQPAIEILRASGEQLQPILKSPAHFFWATGTLSAFLDNAPTYVVFLETACSMSPAEAPGIFHLQGGATVFPNFLVAISLGSVFMGAMTYIGNGPNFMVKSIAEQSGVKMPSFFGYLGYSVLILVPLFVVVTILFI